MQIANLKKTAKTSNPKFVLNIKRLQLKKKYIGILLTKIKNLKNYIISKPFLDFFVPFYCT